MVGVLTGPCHHLSFLQGLLSWPRGFEAMQDFWRIEVGRGWAEAWKARSFSLWGFLLGPSCLAVEHLATHRWVRVLDSFGHFVWSLRCFFLWSWLKPDRPLMSGTCDNQFANMNRKMQPLCWAVAELKLRPDGFSGSVRDLHF